MTIAQNVFANIADQSKVAQVAKQKKATKKPALISEGKTEKKAKTKKPVVTVEPVAAVAVEQEAIEVNLPSVTVEERSFTVRFAEVLTLRNAEQYSADTVNAINNLKNNKAVDIAMSKPEFSEVKYSLLKNARIADSKQNKADFIAVKVLVKIVKALESIGQNMTASLDPYTRTIAENLIALNGISNKSCLVSLSRSVEYSELEQQSALVKRYNCSANTAGTQASSTRMMLKHLQICDVIKGKTGDVITLQDNDRARTFASMFLKS